MPHRVAVLIAVESYQEPILEPVPHAEEGLATLMHALEQQHVGEEDRLVLVGTQATRAAIGARLRRLARDLQPEDMVFFCYIGRAFTQDGESYLTCHDTLADDPGATSLPVDEVLNTFRKDDLRLALFLDLHPAPLPETLGYLDSGTLELLLNEDPWVAFTSCEPPETSHHGGKSKQSIWTHHLAEALAGKAPLALKGGHLLTAGSLARYLKKEVRRTLTRTFEKRPKQTPCLFGGGGESFVLADLQGIIEQQTNRADPRLAPLRRGAFRGETRGRVKSLSGFRKFHRVPDRVTPATQRFVAEVAGEDLQADVDAYYSGVREYLGYKRRDVEVSLTEGMGYLRTPDFDYTVRALQAEDEPTEVVWQREIGNIHTPDLLLSQEFRKVFGGLFDTLVFEFEQPFDVAGWIDQMEDDLPEGVKLNCASDGSSCEVILANFPGVIRLWADHVEVQGPPSRNSTTGPLVETFLQFRSLFPSNQPALLEQKKK